mmetsp:Transcript_12445/g.37959  ORF Transcript_12445/g.37959 Transcript_12445/m.37959 type:complete len:100 (+) Transcript_12445:176-475(+)
MGFFGLLRTKRRQERDEDEVVEDYMTTTMIFPGDKIDGFAKLGSARASDLAKAADSAKRISSELTLQDNCSDVQRYDSANSHATSVWTKRGLNHLKDPV